MPHELALSQTLVERIDALGDDVTLPLRGRATISPERSRADGPGREAIALLRREFGVADGLEMHATLGEGGMGVVRAATQLRLGREVAVKSLRAGQNDELSTLMLLREAWVTGMLEHPNVVPVHDVSLDGAGQPHIVLKRITGALWAALLGHDEEVRERFGAKDPLEWHIRVLLQVANAVGFAHSRGILHRDLKPENVMIGAFGEVYLLDWGIAVSLVDDGTGRLPLARDAVEMAGTPVYMAPEMVCGEPGRLSVRTDVYLLGSVLFEIITGHPPHEGETLGQVIARIAASPPALPASCAPELARIVARAMALEPADRFADVDAFRAALLAHLEHRGSLSLAADGAGRAAALEEALAAPSDETWEERRVAFYRTFAEARFGFLEALRAWPENETARLGLRGAAEAMARFELTGGDPRAASLLLGEIADPDPALRDRVEAARAERAATDRRRQQLEADLDPHIGRRTRLTIGGVLGSAWTLSPLTHWLLERGGLYRRSLTVAAAGSAAMIVVAVLVGYWARESLEKTSLNRRVRASTAIALVSQLALYVAAAHLAMDAHAVETIKLLLFGTVAAHVAVTVDRYFWSAAACYFAAYGASAAWPSQVFLFEAMSSLVLTVTVLVVWGLAKAPPAAYGAVRSRHGGA